MGHGVSWCFGTSLAPKESGEPIGPRAATVLHHPSRPVALAFNLRKKCVDPCRISGFIHTTNSAIYLQTSCAFPPQRLCPALPSAISKENTFHATPIE